MKIAYPVKITFDKNDKRYFVEFYDLAEAITEGETLEEAVFNASEVLTLTLEGRIDEKQEIPAPSKIKGAYMIAPSARVQASLLIKLTRGNHTIAEIARTLESSWPAISRMENPHHWPSLRQLERTASAIGQQLVISFEPIKKIKRANAK